MKVTDNTSGSGHPDRYKDLASGKSGIRIVELSGGEAPP